MADNFIAFDSFDGANFDVSGNEIFPKTTKAEPRRVLGHSNHKRQTTQRGGQEYTIGSLTFGQTDEFRLSLTEAGLSGILVGQAFWGKKTALIGQPDLFAQTSSHQFKFDTQMFQRLSVEIFFQLYSRQDGVKPGYGATLSIRATPRNWNSIPLFLAGPYHSNW